MNKLLVYFCSLLLCIGSSSAGNRNYFEGEVITDPSGEVIRRFAADFDKDGETDSVTITESFGSGFYLVDVLINDGKRNYVYQQEFSSGQILDPVYIDRALYKRYSRLFLDSVFRHPERLPESSLKWLMDGYCSRKPVDHKLFDLVIRYSPGWTKALEVPASYKVPLLENNSAACFGKTDTAVILVYTAHNHFSSRAPGDTIKSAIDSVRDQDGGTSVYTTQHGVIVKRDEKYSWVFISDEQITEGIEKLRVASIKEVRLLGDHVIILQRSISGNRVFIVNYKTGFCMRVRPEVYKRARLTGIIIGKERLVLKTEEGDFPITVKQIKAGAKQLQ